VLFDGRDPEEERKGEEMSGEILRICLRHGGSITGEHGVGADKAPYMPEMFSPQDLDTMQLVRCAFDPAGTFNPGKMFPTPRLCGDKPGLYSHTPRGFGRSVARVTPGSIEEAQALLAEGGRRVLFVGGGTVLPPGPPVDLEISSEKLDRVIEYEPADQVVMVECGLRLAALQRELAKHGQAAGTRSAQPDKATLGGIVRRELVRSAPTRFGSVRDLIIGVSVVRADGTRPRAAARW